MRSQVMFLRLHGVKRAVGVPYAIARRVGAHLFKRRYRAVLPTMKGAISGLTEALKS
jgi:hypothetical protein